MEDEEDSPEVDGKRLSRAHLGEPAFGENNNTDNNAISI